MTELIPFPKPRPRDLSDDLRRIVTDWKASKTKTSGGLMALEERLAARLQAAHREIMSEVLAACDVDGADEVVYEGRTCRRVLTSSRTYMTMAGPVEVSRALYRDRRVEGPSFSPLEKRLGIIDGFWTPKAAREALWMVTQMVPAKAAEALERVGGMQPSKSSLQRLPSQLSATWEEHRSELERVLFETQEVPVGTDVLAVSLDGVYAPIENPDEDESHVETRRRKHAVGEAARGPDAYREVGCASIAFYSAGGDVLGVVRFGRAPEPNKLGVKAMLASYLAAILAKSQRLRVIYLSDGASNHWSFIESLPFDGVQALDFFHAAEHLNAALGAAYGEGSVKARRAFAEKRHILLEEEGGAATVHRALAKLSSMKGRSADAKRTIERATRYFHDHSARMNYAELSALGYPIGSGVMEASCKTLVAQRLKLSGQRWSVAGAQAILTPRSWEQSERFDEAFALLAALYEEEVQICAPVHGQRASG